MVSLQSFTVFNIGIFLRASNFMNCMTCINSI